MGDVVLAGLEVITGVAKDQAADVAASAVVEHVDAQVVPGVYALRADALVKLKGTASPLTSVPAAPDAAPMLVLIHGTFSETHGTFSKLWTEHPQKVRALFATTTTASTRSSIRRSASARSPMRSPSRRRCRRAHDCTWSRIRVAVWWPRCSRACARTPTFANDRLEAFSAPGYEAQLDGL